MKNGFEPSVRLRILPEESIRQIYEAALDVLARTGLAIRTAEGRQIRVDPAQQAIALCRGDRLHTVAHPNRVQHLTDLRVHAALILRAPQPHRGQRRQQTGRGSQMPPPRGSAGWVDTGDTAWIHFAHG